MSISCKECGHYYDTTVCMFCGGSCISAPTTNTKILEAIAEKAIVDAAIKVRTCESDYLNGAHAVTLWKLVDEYIKSIK